MLKTLTFDALAKKKIEMDRLVRNRLGVNKTLKLKPEAQTVKSLHVVYIPICKRLKVKLPLAILFYFFHRKS